LSEKDFKKRNQRWKNGNKEMKERKSNVDRKEDIKGISRKEQVAISRPRTGIKRDITAPRWKGLATHYAPSATPIYPSTTYCEECKGTEDQRTNMDMKKEQWNNGKKGMEKKSDFTNNQKRGREPTKTTPMKCKYYFR
jgi:hypothetical protein